MMGILKKLKEIFGKECFTPGIREALIERKKLVTKYFKREQTTFECSDGEVLDRNFIFTEDLDTLLDFICLERGVEKNTSEIAVGMDSGQKRLIVTLTVNAQEQLYFAFYKSLMRCYSFSHGLFIYIYFLIF